MQVFFTCIKKIRCHNRQLHKATVSKGGIRKANQAPYIVHGFRLFDKVKYRGQIGFIWGRRKTGYFVLKNLDGETIRDGARIKDLTLLEKRSGYLMERRKQDIA